MKLKPYIIGKKLVDIWVIPVEIIENKQTIQVRKVMAVQ